MYLVDTSVWIDFLRNVKNSPVRILNELMEKGIPFGITNIIYQEILQGAASEKDFNDLAKYFGTQILFQFSNNLSSYHEAAKIYFTCRKSGITLRSTIDCMIARIAIEQDLFLLHNDKDFILINKIFPALKIVKFE
jgi:predicted nucleic acid-binding protein